MPEFSVGLERGRYHSVTIQGRSLDLPLINIDGISAQAALALLRALRSKEADLRDMAENYYDCNDCGETHKIGTTCGGEEDEEA